MVVASFTYMKRRGPLTDHYEFQRAQCTRYISSKIYNKNANVEMKP